MKGLYLLAVSLIASTALADGLSIAITDTRQGMVGYEDGVFSGPMASRYQCAIDGLNQAYTVTTFPRTRALRLLKHHQVDLGLPLARTPIRDTYASFSGALFEIEFHLFTQAAETDTPPDTEQVAVVWTSGVLPLIEELGHEVIPVDNHQVGVAMVKRGRTQGVVIPGPLVQVMSPDLEGLVGHRFTTMELGLYVDQNQPELLERLVLAII